jgi:hypothetical protein
VVPSRPPNLQKTKEKLKNPQQPNTQAPESFEEVFYVSLGRGGLRRRPRQNLSKKSSPNPSLFMISFPESQEGLKRIGLLRHRNGVSSRRSRPESQEGLKPSFVVSNPRPVDVAQNLKKG